MTNSALQVLSEGIRPIQGKCEHSKIFFITFYLEFEISDMMWVHWYDNSDRYLIAIHPPHTVVLWDTSSGTKLWKKVYTEQLIMMDIDPFDPIRLACK